MFTRVKKDFSLFRRKILKFCDKKPRLLNFHLRTSPTRHQLISGIGIPLNLENEAITLGLVLKAQYFLIENVDQLKWIYFPDIFG